MTACALWRHAPWSKNWQQRQVGDITRAPRAEEAHAPGIQEALRHLMTGISLLPADASISPHDAIFTAYAEGIGDFAAWLL